MFPSIPSIEDDSEARYLANRIPEDPINQRRKTFAERFANIKANNKTIQSASKHFASIKAKTSELFSKSGIPGMVAYENKTRYRDNDGSGVVSIFDQNAFEIISKTKPNAQEIKKIRGYADGGIIYANNGLLASMRRGIDTELIGAAPGEFMVNREAARANMPILQAINSGHFNRGGIVQYLAKGGIVAPRYYAEGGAVGNVGVSSNNGVLSDMMGQINSLKDAIGSMGNVVKSLDDVAVSLNTGLRSGAELLTNASDNLLTSTNELRNMPTSVEITKHTRVDVAGVSREWNKYEGDLLNMAGEQSSQNFTDRADRVNRRSEGVLDINGIP